jgi:hypothetical protein
MNNQNFLNAVAFIKDMAMNLKVFSDELNTKIAEGEITLSKHSHYVCKDIAGAGSGTTKIIDSQTDKLPGISSIKENRLPKNAAHIFNKIKVSYKAAAAGSNLAALAYGSISKPELQNSLLRFSQNNRTLFEIPVANFGVSQNPQNTTDEYFDFESWLYIRDDEEFDVEVIVPNNLSIAGTAGVAAEVMQALKVQTLGYVTIRKNS